MPKPPSAADVGIDRRTLLRRVCQAFGGVLLAGAVGCAEETPEPETTVRVAVTALEPDGRHVLHRPGMQIEVRRTGDGFAARSLLCTHFGCFVEWSPEEERYLCPCHDGVFDADGGVLYGPPPRPLTDLPVRRESEHLLVDISTLVPGGEDGTR